jgi:sugar lactone lactonase YvrE
MKKTLLIFSLFLFSFPVFSQIVGPTVVCKGQKGVVYNIVQQMKIKSAWWTLPQGSTIINQYITQIRINGITYYKSVLEVDYSNLAISGDITVIYDLELYGYRTQTLAVNINNSAPIPAGSVTGESTVFAGQTNVSYSIPLIADTTSYEWTLPSGATGTSTTNSISVNYGLTSVSGYLTVKGVNSCGVGVASTLVITVNPFGTIITKAPSISYVSPQTFALGTPISIKPTNTGGPVPATVYGQVSTLAGNGTSGATDGIGSVATFNGPSGIAIDADRNLYITDQVNFKIRKISPTGIVSTLAGNGTQGSTDGIGILASFNYTRGLALDALGNLYIADKSNSRIRKITPSGIVSTLAGSSTSGAKDGIGSAASFNQPAGIALDAKGNLFVADEGNNKIRKITSTGVVTTLAGNGNGGYIDGTVTVATFNRPYGIAIDRIGNLYIADSGNNKIRKITTTGIVSTLAGGETAGVTDGPVLSARFRLPSGIAVDVIGNVYVADLLNNKIRKISPAGIVSTLAGSGVQGVIDGTNTVASFDDPNGVAVDEIGNVFVTEGSNKIRKITITGYSINPIVLPLGLSFDATTGIISGTPTALSSATSYTVTAYNAAGSSSATIVISTSTLGLNKFSEGNIKFFPNPTNSVFNLSINNGISLEKIIIVDTSGKVVLEQTENLSSINVEKLPNGVYILTAYSEDKKYQEKFIKE